MLCKIRSNVCPDRVKNNYSIYVHTIIYAPLKLTNIENTKNKTSFHCIFKLL